MDKKKRLALTDETVISRIHLVRNHKVMLDKDLAQLYGVTTGNLNRAVKRNLSRFPTDFMFQLAESEFRDLIFQNGTSSKAGWGGTRKLPYAFIEQGVAMLSSVLNSERAISVNIHIIRVFTRMRQMLITHKDILLKLERVERELLKHNGQLKKHGSDMQIVFTALKQLLQPKTEPTRRIGFRRNSEG